MSYSEEYVIRIVVEARLGNRRNHEYRFEFRADTRAEVAAYLLEAGEGIKGLPRPNGGAVERTN